MTPSQSSSARKPAQTSSADWAGERGDKWRDQLEGMERMLKPIDEPLIQALELNQAYRIADLGSGGGGTTLAILREAPSGSVVHGLDISASLISAARERIPQGLSSLEFLHVDISTAEPSAPLYDRLASRFGIMFFEEPAAAFQNIARWLRPGGRFAFAVWASPKENGWIASVRDIVAKLVDVPAPEPDAPGPFRYADSSSLSLLLEGAGLKNIRTDNWKGALALGGGLNATDAVEFVLQSFSNFRELLEGAGSEVENTAKQLLNEHFSLFEREGQVILPASVHILSGDKPE